MEANNKVKTLVSQSQRKAATICKTPIELPSVSIYNNTDIYTVFLKIGIHTQISHHTITKEIYYNIENFNQMTLGTHISHRTTTKQAATIFKTPIKLPSVPINNDTDI